MAATPGGADAYGVTAYTPGENLHVVFDKAQELLL
jgi:hypothetical protein